MRLEKVVRRHSDIMKMSFPFELLHAKGPATNMTAFHWHDFVEISFVRAGTGMYEIEDKTFRVGPGDIIIINDTERHRVTYDPARPLHETVLHFSGALLEWSNGHDAGSARTLSLFRSDAAALANKPALSTATRRSIRRLIGEIREEWEGRRPWFETLIRAKLTEIMSLLLRARGSRAPLSPPVVAARRQAIARLEKVVDWLRANYHRPVRLAEIASRFSMRPSYFSDYFRRNLGVTFTDYLMHLRVLEAARLIEQGGAASADAAFSCGFATRATFYRAFKKVMGVNPGEWLRVAATRAATKMASRPAENR